MLPLDPDHLAQRLECLQQKKARVRALGERCKLRRSLYAELRLNAEQSLDYAHPAHGDRVAMQELQAQRLHVLRQLTELKLEAHHLIAEIHALDC